MKCNNHEFNSPSFFSRIFSVWFRHMKVYTKHIFSNGLPPFLEPLLFLAGIGFGLGKYVKTMDNLPYILFLATGVLVTSSMFTASYECTFGTFIRLEFDKVYDGILAAPISPRNLIVGEILWAGTKGFFFSFAVLVVIACFGIISYPLAILAPLVGFINGLMFSTLALSVTSYVKSINHFNFFFTGFLSPMFFFSGVIFPVSNLPKYVKPFVEIVPLTHSVRLSRAICIGDRWSFLLLWDLIYIILFIIIVGNFAIYKLTNRLVK